MQENGGPIDRVLPSRPELAASRFGATREHASAIVMYHGHDMHHIRIAGQRRIHAHETPPRAGFVRRSFARASMRASPTPQTETETVTA
jgi:hypothetical protein